MPGAPVVCMAQPAENDPASSWQWRSLFPVVGGPCVPCGRRVVRRDTKKVVDCIHDVALAEEHGLGGRSEWDEAVGAGDSRQSPLVAVVDQRSDDALGYAAALPGLVHDKNRGELFERRL